jgi:outer membrane protein TolC
MGVRPEPGMTRFLPTENPPKNFNVTDADELVDIALKNNLDLQASQKNVELTQIQRTAAKWKVLPSVNLYGSLNGSGLAGSPQDIIFGGDTLRASRSGTFSNALTQVTRRDYPGWTLGVEINIPIGMRSGLGERDRLEAEVYGAQQMYIAMSRSLEEQVRSAWRELSHGKHRMNAALDAVNAAQDQVRIGLIEFHNGRSTAFELVRLGTDLAVAQQQYSEALVRTAKAVSALKQLTSGKYNLTSQ